jgi:hypothetical protein
MGKAAGFRLVFGRMIESLATADRIFDVFVGASGAGKKASKGWK